MEQLIKKNEARVAQLERSLEEMRGEPSMQVLRIGSEVGKTMYHWSLLPCSTTHFESGIVHA